MQSGIQSRIFFQKTNRRIFLENDEKQITELTGLPVYRRAQLGVGYLAQEASVFRRLSVG